MYRNNVAILASFKNAFSDRNVIASILIQILFELRLQDKEPKECKYINKDKTTLKIDTSHTAIQAIDFPGL
eukprot:snap_masked-scaffold_2-processed-gene-16.7-mRNA-1 protein AED:1.00 eAED:1.00 QI:0/0/0/0/1/1/2/0/70